MPEHQIRALFQSDMVQVEDYRCPGTDVSHSDEECAERHEIVLLRSGAFVRYDSFGECVADVNHILFFHKNQPYQIAHPVPGGDRSTIFGIHISTLQDMMRSYNPAVNDRPDRPFSVTHAVVDTQQRLIQYQLLQAAFRGGDKLEIEEQILMLLAQVIRHAHHLSSRASKHSPATACLHHEIVDHIKVTLSRRFAEKIDLSQLAAAVSVSPYFLCRIFKDETRLSIHQYLVRLRLMNALEHIAEQPGDSLAQIALDLGFSSHSHFSTAFLREFGMTPSAFRFNVTGNALLETSKILKA